ncbi:MAG: hypothetical protein M3548_04635, partial [Actinomycetota bacterium]|nr:hypothetical protein [Actinomycetota bacterium]
MPNSITNEYLENCRRPGSELTAVARKVALPDVYAKSFGSLLLDRPVFVPETEVRGFADDLSALFDLLVSLPERLCDGDLLRFCAELGTDRRLAELMCRGATGRPPLHGRADAYHDGTSFKLLEFNVGSELGGTDSAQVNRSY